MSTVHGQDSVGCCSTSAFRFRLDAVPTEPVPVPAELPPIVVPAVPVDTDDSPVDSEPTTPAPQS